MEYDPDDPPPTITPADVFWFFANRWAQVGMGLARLCGMQERQAPMLILRCEAPGCMKPALHRRKLQDPRRGHGEDLAYVTRHFCSFECEGVAAEELERQATYARVCH